MTECPVCGALFATTGCPKCNQSVKAPGFQRNPPRNTSNDELRTLLLEIQKDLEPLRDGSYSDGIKQLTFRLKEENNKLRKENAELAAQLKSTKAALKAWEEGRET